MDDANGFLRQLADSLSEHVVVVDTAGVIQFVNRAWVDFGVENGLPASQEWVGQNYLTACDAAAASGDEDGEGAARGIRSVTVGGGDFSFEYPCHSPTEKRWFMMRVTELSWSGPRRLVVTHQNITQRKLAEERARELALLDGLTGVANRRYLDSFLDNEWRRTVRLGTPISLIMADIDYFKDYSDAYGHPEGDAALKKVASLLRTRSGRPGDLAARYGEEEFAVLLAETDAVGATAIAQRVRSAVQAATIPHEHSSAADVVTVSVGVCALAPRRGDLASELVNGADRALYQSKSAGRNRVTVAGDKR